MLCCVWLLSCVRLFATHELQTSRFLCPWGFSRQECWSGLPLPPPGGLPNPGIEPRSPTLLVDSLSSEPLQKPEGSTVSDKCSPSCFHLLFWLCRIRCSTGVGLNEQGDSCDFLDKSLKNVTQLYRCCFQAFKKFC